MEAFIKVCYISDEFKKWHKTQNDFKALESFGWVALADQYICRYIDVN